MVTTSNIYLITNLIDNKKYVGQASNVEERWYRHSVDYKRLKSRYLYRAMNKHGIENFIFEIIESNISIDLISEREIFWIEKMSTKAPNGYNMTSGGEGSHNRILTEESRKKISISLKGTTLPEETKRKMSLAHTKRYENAEERLKMSESHKNNKTLIENATKTMQKVNKNMTKEQRVEYQTMAAEKRSKAVLATSLLDNTVTEFKSLRFAARWIRENTEYEKACHTNISKACRNKLDYVYGYRWELKDKCE